ncbi:MAG: adenosylcobalamin-dependent ribonucleoside-diphosphate reductase [Candidatus Thermoplasmatota archaeon]|nr:adenosylcobalamin-dependent ribonucleoside-diphosphate reductase [Candidatus Thermoplasmatota archaeon]
MQNIIKRDGSVVKFDRSKISRAIYKAMLSSKNGSFEDAEKITDVVVEKISTIESPTVEQIQDAVENALMDYNKDGKNFKDVARSYILYREKRRLIREEKKRLGINDDLKLTLNAVKVLETRYLLKNQKGEVVETPRGLFRRVAHAMALVESLYDYMGKQSDVPKDRLIIAHIDENDRNQLKFMFERLLRENAIGGNFQEFINYVETKPTSIKYYEEEFELAMENLEFIPNSPTLMNAGTDMGQLSACFVLPVGDSIDEIFDTLKNTAKIHKSGGGTGFSFSRLRPKDDRVKSTMGVASGPVSFMKIFDVTTDVIKQGGKRRGANMAVLRYDHPDIIEFVTSKDPENTVLSNFNISVGVDAGFFRALDDDSFIELKNPRSGEVSSRIKARFLWDKIVDSAWRTGDPGMIFLDEINDKNTVQNIGSIEATNPCGEQPLMPYESCNLGSINLGKFVRNNDVDWNALEHIIRLSVRFLDNVVDANVYPIPEIESMTRKTRKIGLGVMGFADMLMKLRIPYASNAALSMGEKIMSFIQNVSHEESENLAKIKGVFPGWEGSYWSGLNRKMRNSTTTTIAPTGTISIIAGCSSSIEPIFALAFVRRVLDGQELLEVNPVFEDILREKGLYSPELMAKISVDGTVSDTNLPSDLKELFRTSREISYEWHILMQATFQNYCDSGVSKTINMPNSATREDIERAYRLARDLHCKGITIYRDGSKTAQVLYAGNTGSNVVPKVEKPDIDFIISDLNSLKIDSTFDPACPGGVCER